MSAVIRLQRQGSKNSPNFLVVAVNKRGKRDGEYLENLGQYFPKEKNPKLKIKIDLEAIKKWQSKGAVLSETVGQLLKANSK
jgi:small subunit ribosomal protein S16